MIVTGIRAAVLESFGRLEVMDLDSLPLEYGQVLVKILFSGVCRSQLMEVRGDRGHDPWLPHLLGHEGSGVVVAIGEGVVKVAPGDEVILGWVKGTGIDAVGARYRSSGRIINSGRVTTFSTYSVVSENRLVKKPAQMPLAAAVLFGCALPTGAGMVLNELKPSPESSVVVLGLGGVGISALVALRAIRNRMVIAIDIVEEKLEIARQLGATYVFNAATEELPQSVFDITNGGADFCIESGGRVSTIELGYSLIRKGGGKMLFASHPPEGDVILLAPHDLISGKQIAGSWGGATSPDQDIPKMWKLMKDVRIPLESLLGKHYSLEQINDALTDIEAGMVFRPLIVMNHNEKIETLDNK